MLQHTVGGYTNLNYVGAWCALCRTPAQATTPRPLVFIRLSYVFKVRSVKEFKRFPIRKIQIHHRYIAKRSIIIDFENIKESYL